MKDIKGFCKLMDISVPEYEHFDYYLEQLCKLDRWKNLREMIVLYEKAEETITDMFDYKIKKSNEIIGFLQGTRAFNELTDDNLLPELPITKNFEYLEDKKYLSIDIRQANWSVLKKYDPQFLNELGDTYEDLLKRFDMPELLKYSKQFRQYIFGNINPKRQAKAQRLITQEIIEKYKHLGLKITCIKNDEVIYSFDSFDDITEILQTLNLTKFKTKLFTIKRIKDFRINVYMDESGRFLHKELAGCNGNQYFLCLKKYILEEPIDIRDLYFRMDGNLAIWSVDELKVELK